MRLIDTKEEEQTRDLLDESGEANRAILNSLLAALRTRDVDTYDHSKRTVCLSLLLGRECGLDRGRMRGPPIPFYDPVKGHGNIVIDLADHFPDRRGTRRISPASMYCPPAC